MQSVDSNFLTCIYSPSKYEELTGTIVLNNNVSMPIDLSDIVEGTTTIVWDSTDGKKDISFGVSVCSELEISIYTELDRYALEKAQITLNHRVFNKPPVYENNVIVNGAIYSDCPLGIFTATTVTVDRSVAHILAYDNIKKLDAPCGTTVFAGSPREILDKVCRLTGISLHNTAEQIAALPNGYATLQFDTTTGAKTYRDIVRYTLQLLGACARADRTTGDLEVFTYATSTTAIITKRQRKSSKPEDYKCQFSGITVTGAKGTFSSIDRHVPGEVMVVDDAPAWDYGTDLALRTYITNVGNYVRTINYTPCEVEMFNNPMYDCGDLLSLEIDSNPAHNVDILVSMVTWKFRNSVEIKSIGSNGSEVSSASSSERQAYRTADANKLVSYDVTNNDSITLNDGDTITLCNVSFTSAQATHAMWLANILLDATADNDYTDVKVTYYYDNIELEYYPQEHYVDGDHTFSLFFPISAISEQSIHRWRVDITAIDGTITIGQYDFRGTLFGQNLVESDAMWDGILTLDDLAPYITPIVVLDTVQEGDVEVSLCVPIRTSLQDSIDFVTALNQLQTVTETCTISTEYVFGVMFCRPDNLDAVTYCGEVVLL